jgi:hypothetical protein
MSLRGSGVFSTATNWLPHLIRLFTYASAKLLLMDDKRTDARTNLEAQMEKTDAEIDELVYFVYGITDSEKNLIQAQIDEKQINS